MQLEQAHEENMMSRQQHLDSERDRKMRIQSIISGRGIEFSRGDSVTSEDVMGLNTERILEERLDKEQELNR